MLRAPPPAAAALADDEIDGGSDAAKEVFCEYVSSVTRGKKHPGDIAEASSLSAIPLPPTSYPLFDALPPAVVDEGRLSQLQLEGILYACARHQHILPSGERAGFFIGDGAGVGKGRQIAGAILDNYARGRRRAVWLSTSADLHYDATRDLRDLGAHGIPVINNLQALDRANKALGLPRELQEGVLFVTYATLVSGAAGGRSRLDQVVEWVKGAAFDGLLVFDECHKAKNSGGGGGGAGRSKEGSQGGTKVAAAVIELQRRLPRARVLYASATGVSEVANMAYMAARMHLSGPGTAFADFDALLESLKKRGVSFLELLAMDMKAAGKYVARGLSFRRAEFLELGAPLTPRQAAMYDAAAAYWRELRAGLERALELTSLPPSSGGGGGGAGGRRDAWKPFWGAHQRFFKSLCVSLKVPAVVREAKAALAAGQCVVIGLQSTGESAADASGLAPGPVAGFVSTTRELLARFLDVHFPAERGVSAEGAAAGLQPRVVPEAAALRDDLRAKLDALPLPPSFLDQLIDALGGPGQVAEMTGRKGRVLRDASGRARYELRAKPDSNDMDSLNARERDAFMAGRKLVAIISDAASTGISLHADRRAANQRRRVHLTIELPWSADKAIQQLGRSHRSNQTVAPIYKLVTTPVGGEKRFAAAVARRLQSLGALTRGDRRAASGIDLSGSSFDSPWGRASLRRMYDRIVQESPALPAGVSIEAVVRGCGADAGDLRARYAPWLPAAEGDGGGGSGGGDNAADAAAAAAQGEQQQQQQQQQQPARGADLSLERALAAAALHRDLREDCDVMGVGLGLPRGDTVAEERAIGGGGAGGAGAGGAAGGSRDQGDVRRFLNRLLGLPLARQNLLFSYFSLTLQAEIAAAKAEGRYSEGVGDLLGSSITLKGAPYVLWQDPGAPAAAQRVLVQTLLVDRGVRYADAARRLAREARPGDLSGFRRSRRPMFGAHMVALALAKPGQKTFTLIRPNTGEVYEIDRAELDTKYVRADAGPALEAEWGACYEGCLAACMHGAHCVAGPNCQVGRRVIEVTLLTGAVVRVWGVLEALLEKRAVELPRADRAMRVVRVALGQRGSASGAGGAELEHQQQQLEQEQEQQQGQEEQLEQQEQQQQDSKQQQQDSQSWEAGPSEEQQQQDSIATEEQPQQQQQPQAPVEYLVGVRYPAKLLPEAVAMLANLQAEATAAQAAFAHAAATRLGLSPAAALAARAGGAGLYAEAAAAAGGSSAAALATGEVEPPAPVDPKSLARALRAPKTIHDFFKAAPSGTAAGAGGGGGSEAGRSAGSTPPVAGSVVVAEGSASGSGSVAKKGLSAKAGAAGGGTKRGGKQPQPPSTQQRLSFSRAPPPPRAPAVIVIDDDDDDDDASPGNDENGGGPGAANGGGGDSAPPIVGLKQQQQQQQQQQGLFSPSFGHKGSAAAAAAEGRPPDSKRPRLAAAESKGSGGGGASGGGASGGGSSGGGGSAAMAELVAMGFAEDEARRALWLTGGNAGRAVELLLNGARQ